MQLTIDDLTQMIGDLKRRLSEIPTDSVEPSASARAAIELALQTVTLVNEVLPLLTSFQVTMATFNVPHAEAAKAGVKYVATRRRAAPLPPSLRPPPTPRSALDSAAEEERDGGLKRPGPDVPDGAQKRVKVAPTGADGNSSALDQPAGLYKATEPLQSAGFAERRERFRARRTKFGKEGQISRAQMCRARRARGASGSKQDASLHRLPAGQAPCGGLRSTVVVRGVARACDAKRRVLTGDTIPARGDARRTVGRTGIPTPVSSWRRTRTRGVRKKRRRSRPGPCP